MSKPDIHRLLELQRLLAAFNRVDRIVHRKHQDAYVYENDTEHSYNLAMTAWFLSEYFPELDRNIVIRYSLVHDLVEVHAGDTYIYGPQAELDSKHEREQQALAKLSEDWADFESLTEDITAYESLESEEAKFVYALDKIMPIMLIYIHNGYSWQKAGITPEQLDAAKRSKVAISPAIDAYYQQLYALVLENEHLFKP